MLRSYACRQCKARLPRRPAVLRAPQWQPRATFISLRAQKEPTVADPSPTNTEASTKAQQTEKVVHANDRSGSGSYTRNSSEQGRVQPRPSGRYSRHLRENPNVKSDAIVQQETHHPQPSWQYSRSARDTPSEQRGTLEGQRISPQHVRNSPTEQNNTTLRREVQYHHYPDRSQQEAKSFARPITMALSNGDLEQAWPLFKETYTSKDCEALTANVSMFDMSQLSSGKLTATLLSETNKAFINSTGAPSVTPTEVLFKFEQLRIARPNYWHDTLTDITHSVISAIHDPKSTDAAGKRDLRSLLIELISIWRLFFQCTGFKTDPLEAVSTEWNLPNSDFLKQHVSEHSDLNFRMQEYHPKIVGNPKLGFSATYIFSLAKALDIDDTLKQQSEPFIRFLAHMLAGANVKKIFTHTQSSPVFKSFPQEWREYIFTELSGTPRKALEMLGMSYQSRDGDDIGDSTTGMESFFVKRIARAVESKTSSTTLYTVWKQAKEAYTPRSGKTALPPRIYDACLSGFTGLYQPEQCVEVWNHMIAHGIHPTAQTWVALMEGCKKARDLDGLNAAWQRATNTALEPDNYMWTARINGLMSLRQINPALGALDEMGNRWLAAEKAARDPQSPRVTKEGTARSANKCTKPSVEVVNGALSAIVKIPLASMRQNKRIEMIQKILRWGQGFAIKPDAITYNILLQLYLQAGEFKTGFQVLDRMEQENIQADIATYTMLISAAFDNQAFHQLSESEQTSRLLQTFSDLEAAGLRLNIHVYSVAIDRLLRQYSNYHAVRALIDHMQTRNLVPSAYIYTSMITHYFEQEPPAIEAVDSLVHQIFNGQRVPTDRFLFERIIEGYAANAEVGKMMSVLTRMSKNGNLPGWRTLGHVVHALVAADDIEGARRIVRECERGEGVAHSGIIGSSALQRKFFYEVAALGIELDGAYSEKHGDMFSQGSVADFMHERDA